MAHKQVLFRSEARERILRGVARPRRRGSRHAGSEIEVRPSGEALRRAGGVQRRRHDRQGDGAEGSRGEPGGPDDSPGRGAHRRRGGRRHQHVHDPRPRDLRRRRAQRGGRGERGGSEEGARPRRPRGGGGAQAAVPAREESAREGADRHHLRPQRPEHRRHGRRRDGEGGQRRRDHGRGVQDDGDPARGGRGAAVRPRLPVAVLHHRRGEDGGGSRGHPGPPQRPEDRRDEGPGPDPRAGGARGALDPGHRGGRRGGGARHPRGQQDPRLAQVRRGEGARDSATGARRCSRTSAS